ncbi:hypothetical protein [Aliagarivorans taiwanensis]|uniref:hypothetical protein n=1 Tax=Aliagarivorans taiwanensis TaxID=561966 RepID=UPI00047A343B|nr:hypothetical protein [Aliagarivorans taiwanensis]
MSYQYTVATPEAVKLLVGIPVSTLKRWEQEPSRFSYLALFELATIGANHWDKATLSAWGNPERFEHTLQELGFDRPNSLAKLAEELPVGLPTLKKWRHCEKKCSWFALMLLGLQVRYLSELQQSTNYSFGTDNARDAAAVRFYRLDKAGLLRLLSAGEASPAR